MCLLFRREEQKNNGLIIRIDRQLGRLWNVVEAEPTMGVARDAPRRSRETERGVRRGEPAQFTRYFESHQPAASSFIYLPKPT